MSQNRDEEERVASETDGIRKKERERERNDAHKETRYRLFACLFGFSRAFLSLRPLRFT